jgi:oligoribonuclease (3'-5' exoribonuclease)
MLTPAPARNNRTDLSTGVGAPLPHQQRNNVLLTFLRGNMMQPYIAIDIETTGLDPMYCQVLELACVIETDWRTPVDQLPTFRRLVNPGVIRGDSRALAMNARLIEELADGEGVPDLDGQLIDLSGFLAKYPDLPRSVTIAGKNFGAFDEQFLRRSAPYSLIRHKHRFIDVGNLFWNPFTDTCLPDLATCRERAGLPIVEAHDAAQDCRSVIECVRAAFATSRHVARC